jgi:hypothetical protein
MRKSIRKIILCFMMILLVFSSCQKKAQAVAWPDIIGNAFGSALDEMFKQISGMIMGAAKQAAVQAVESQVSSIISGGKSGSGGAMFITNPKQFLNIDPQKQTKLFMNDFFSMTTRGTNSAANYASTQASGSISNYSNYLVQQAKQSINGNPPQTNLQEYTNDPTDLFGQGNWQAFSAYISNPANNQFGYTLMAQDAYMGELENQQQEAMAKFIAYQGFKGTEQDGNIVTPGSTVKDIYSQVQDIGNKALANANTMPEIITALITRLVTKTITQGIGDIQSNLDKENNQQDTGYW